MKYFIFYLLLAFTFSLSAKEYVPQYSITKSVEDKSLKKTEASFTLTFYDSDGDLINRQIVFSYNTTEKKQEPNAKGEIFLNVKPGKYLFKFFYNLNHDEITTDSILIKPGFRTEIRIDFTSPERPVIMKKPVIYVYPKQKEQVSIKLDIKGDFLFTYPEYKNGWDLTAEPDGTIQMADKKYHYLFWDANVTLETEKLNLNQGFVVNKKDLIKFFEEKLVLMGLNSQETEDYITYWCPLMSKNEKNYIHFMFNEEYNNYASITINPKPDHLFRVCMLWSKANANVEIEDQKIETFKRTGFTVVEWGGTEMNFATKYTSLK